MKERLEEQPKPQKRFGYKVEKNTTLYYATLPTMVGTLIPAQLGEFGVGFYCADNTSVPTRYLSELANPSILRLLTKGPSYHFRMNDIPTQEELKKISISMRGVSENPPKYTVEKMAGILGERVVEALVEGMLTKDHELENQTSVRGMLIKKVLSKAGYDGVAALDSRRGGMILTFFDPEKKLIKVD